MFTLFCFPVHLIEVHLREVHLCKLRIETHVDVRYLRQRAWAEAERQCRGGHPPDPFELCQLAICRLKPHGGVTAPAARAMGRQLYRRKGGVRAVICALPTIA